MSAGCSVLIFLFINMVSFTVIAVSYAIMYSVARKTQREARSSDTRVCQRRFTTSSKCGGDSNTMGRRMTLIVATDAACWLPIIALGIASLCGVHIPDQVFSWIAVFVLPLNAAVNPVLYTLSTLPVKKRLQTLLGALSMGRAKHNRKPSTFSVSSNWKNSLRFRTVTESHEFSSIACHMTDHRRHDGSLSSRGSLCLRAPPHCSMTSGRAQQCGTPCRDLPRPVNDRKPSLDERKTSLDDERRPLNDSAALPGDEIRELDEVKQPEDAQNTVAEIRKSKNEETKPVNSFLSSTGDIEIRLAFEGSVQPKPSSKLWWLRKFFPSRWRNSNPSKEVNYSDALIAKHNNDAKISRCVDSWGRPWSPGESRTSSRRSDKCCHEREVTVIVSDADDNATIAEIIPLNEIKTDYLRVKKLTSKQKKMGTSRYD